MSTGKEMWMMCPCGCEEYTEQTVVEHMEQLHKEMLFKCNINQCEKMFWKVCDLRAHIEKSEAHLKFRRDHEKLFNVKEILDKRSHRYTHHFLNLKVSNSKLALDNLILFPVDLKEYRCRVCKANKSHFCSFLWDNAINHILKTHPKFPTHPKLPTHVKFRCRACIRDDFPDELNLQQHIDDEHSQALKISSKSRLSESIKNDSDSDIEIMEVSGSCISGSCAFGSNLTESITSPNQSSKKQSVASHGSGESSFPLNDMPHVQKRSQPEMDQSLLVQRTCPAPSSSTSTKSPDECGDESCLPCSFCKLSVPNSRDSCHLKEHYDFLFKCATCRLGFEEYGKVQTHVVNSHKSVDKKDFRTLILQPGEKFLKMFKCGVAGCGQKFMGQQGERDLIEHIEKIHEYHAAPERNILNICRICENKKIFASLKELEDHIKNRHRCELFVQGSSKQKEVKSPLNADVREDDDYWDEGFYTKSSSKKITYKLKTKRKARTTEKTKDNFQQKNKPYALISEYMGKSNLHQSEEEKANKNQSSNEAYRTLSKVIDEKLRANSSENYESKKVNEDNSKLKLLDGVDTASIKDLLKSVATATDVATTIKKKIERNKTKRNANSHHRENESTSDTDSTSSSDSEARGYCYATKKGLKLGKRKKTTEQNHVNKETAKRMKRKATDFTNVTPIIRHPQLDKDVELINSSHQTLAGKAMELAVTDEKRAFQIFSTLANRAKVASLSRENTFEKETDSLSRKMPEEEERPRRRMRKLSIVEKKIQQKLVDQKSSGNLGESKVNIKEKINVADGKLKDRECNVSEQMPNQETTENQSMDTIMLYCPFCEKHFLDKPSFGEHIYDDHETMLFRCKSCSKLFGNTEGLLNHVKTDHGLKGWPEESIGNNSHVELPEKFLQKIVCSHNSCSLSSEVGRNGFWLGRDMKDVKTKIIEHNLLTNNKLSLGMSVGDKIELRCRVCTNYNFKVVDAIASSDEDWENGWLSHFAQDHYKILSNKVSVKNTQVTKPSPSSILGIADSRTSSVNIPKWVYNNQLKLLPGSYQPGVIYVSNIPSKTKESELFQLFSTFGNVKQTKIIKDMAGDSKGFGFITFETDEEARRLYQGKGDNIILKGRKLKIAPALKKGRVF